MRNPAKYVARLSSLRGGVGRRSGLLRAGALKPGGELIEPLGTTRWRFYDRGSGGRPCLLSCGRCRIEFAVALLDSPGANMALYRDTDMVRAIAGTRRVKFLPGFTGRQGENALTQPRALRAGFTSRQLACSGSWRPPATSRGNGGLCFCSRSRSGSPSGWRLANARQHALGRLEIGQLSGDLFTVGIEARKTLANLRLLCADLVQYRRCRGRHDNLQ